MKDLVSGGNYVIGSHVRRHRREFWLQILLPILLAGIVVFGGSYLLLASDVNGVDRFAQIATMLIILPLLLIGLTLLLLLVLLIYALDRLMNWLPPNAFWLQRQVARLNGRVRRAADLAVKPVFLFEGWTSAVKRLLNRPN